MIDRYVLLTYSLVTVIIAIFIYLGLSPLLDISTSHMLLDSIVSGIVLSSLLILLRFIIRYNHFSSLVFIQRIINYSALAILFAVCWLGLNYLLLQALVSPFEYGIWIKTIPLRVIFSLLIYGLAILFYNYQSVIEVQKQVSEDMEEECESEQNPIEEQKERTEQKEVKEILERIAVKNGIKIEVIPVSEVIHLQAEGDYVMIHSTKGRFLKEQTMKSFESDLPKDKFVRVHRSSIINVEYIAQIELYDKQSQLLKLKNGAHVKISLAGYKALKKTLGL